MVRSGAEGGDRVYRDPVVRAPVQLLEVVPIRAKLGDEGGIELKLGSFRAANQQLRIALSRKDGHLVLVEYLQSPQVAFEMHLDTVAIPAAAIFHRFPKHLSILLVLPNVLPTLQVQK